MLSSREAHWLALVRHQLIDISTKKTSTLMAIGPIPDPTLHHAASGGQMMAISCLAISRVTYTLLPFRIVV
jgi:hypothetical protein